MRYPEPMITTRTVGALVRITARYESPETGRLMESLRAMMAVACFVGLSIGAALILSRQAAISNQVWLVSLVASIVLAWLVSCAVADALHDHRFGIRRWSDSTLVVEIARGTVAHAGRTYPRGGVLRFTAAPHRDGRHEERAERSKERLLPTTYRDAYQVWLQHGEAIVLLASVSDERAANAIVRRLQEVDEQVTRGGFPAERGSVYGERQVPC